ncbi:S8 family peptidase [Allocoleopsis franciscana]|uniref:Subtilisin-like serine protease n=1 Tax=Allocoleopsis franciscana PCC 7113 TaxID=1173027 RepID=K9WFX9_9CYAN|nr:S8 family serine peptidase [Allocoleopsis franciscana]AFZ19088.1 subtilisin-like serine protease [Allocoleopsis franciscana PCC 7113]
MINKRFFSRILLTGYILGVGSASPLVLSAPSSAQAQASDELYYTYFEQKIPLTLRSDAIAVAFKPVGRTRGTRSNQPLHLQLQQDLQKGAGTRGSTRAGTLKVEVSPLGENYALVNLPSGTRSSPTAVQQQIQQQPYVETTLPVLSRPATPSPSPHKRPQLIVLPNEILVNFKPGVSESEKQSILAANSLEMIRPLRFSQNRYLVRSKTVTGTAVLGVANRLNSQAKVQSATPNFIQSLTNQSYSSASIPGATLKPPHASWKLKNPLLSLLKADNSPIKTALLPVQWHLNSTPLSTCLNQRREDKKGLMEYLTTCFNNRTLQAAKTSLPRTDMRVIDAWKNSNQGNNVVVAVIDTLIQWNHPDLAGNLHNVGDIPDRLPGEVSGWDFVENDPDTRMSKNELTILKGKFQDAFLATADELRQKYPDTFQEAEQENPEQSVEEIANRVRYRLLNSEVAGEFHGTMVAGVVTARPQEESGVVGVAPKAKLLPVRVLGLNGSFSVTAYLEGMGYAASRGADVINISLGGRVPTQGEAELISEVLQANPKLVIVASAGNENLNEIGFPAAFPGVVAVGATNLAGNRAPYSNYGATHPLGQGVTLVAPGGDMSSPGLIGGILTTGGTWLDEFWQDLPTPGNWGPNQDTKGKYRWTQGTSFSSPAVAGAIALMKGEDSTRRLTREQLVTILKQTASYNGLAVNEDDAKLYRSQLAEKGIPRSISQQQYFFGSGLVNADAAVKVVKQKLR